MLRPHFEWRGLGFISQSALALSEAYADFDAERRFAVPGVRVADPKACQCGEVLKGVIKPWECKVFGTACTPEHAIGTCMVSPGGRLRRLLQLRALRPREGGRVSVDRPGGADPRDHRDRARQAPALQGPRHHDGPRRRRQGDADADRGPVRARLRRRDARRHGRRRRGRRHGDDHRLLRGQAAALPGRLDRRAGRQRHRQRPRGRGRPPARADRGDDPRGGPGLRRPARRGRGDRARRRGGRRRDRRRRHQGRRARPRRPDVPGHHRRRPPRPARRASARRASGPATRSCCPARSASTAPRSCSPAASSSSRPTWSPTRARCGRSPTRCSRPPGPGCAACATRPAAASPRC